jgi:hypothetical protein
LYFLFNTSGTSSKFIRKYEIMQESIQRTRTLRKSEKEETPEDLALSIKADPMKETIPIGRAGWFFTCDGTTV